MKKKIICIYILTLMFVLNSFCAVEAVNKTNELKSNEVETHESTFTKISTLEIDKSLSETTGKGNSEWVEIDSDEWNYLAEDSEWGKIGKVNQILTFYKLKYDKVEKYDWYAIVWTIQVIPGHVAFGGDNAWHLSDIWNWVDGDRYKDYTELVSYGPYSTQGTKTVTYKIGVRAGMDGAGVSVEFSKSYSIPDINVHDQSDYSKELAEWWHDINYDTQGWDKVTTIEPGMVFRVDQSKNLHLNFTTRINFITTILGVPWLSFKPTLYWEWSNVKKNYGPDIATITGGPDVGDEEKSYTFFARAEDSDCDQLMYEFWWDDGDITETGWFDSNKQVEASHTWSDSDEDDDTHYIKVRAKDKNGYWSEDWSDPHVITIKDDDEKGKSRHIDNNPLRDLLKTDFLQILHNFFLFLYENILI